MKESIDKENNQIVKKILHFYFHFNLSDKIEKEVKLWLISDFRKKEKQDFLWELWNNLHIDEKNKSTAWKDVMRKCIIQATIFQITKKDR